MRALDLGKGTTKAAYWRSLSDLQRTLDINEAERLVFIVKALKPIRILSLVDFK